MGIFYTIFYAMGVAGPIVGGWAATMAGTSAVTFDVGVLMLAGCFLAYAGFRQVSGPET